MQAGEPPSSQIAASAWIGHDAFWVDPLYAYFLGAIYRVTGHGLLLPRLANMTFGVLTAIFAARIAWRCWGSRLAAVLTAQMPTAMIARSNGRPCIARMLRQRNRKRVRTDV